MENIFLGIKALSEFDTVGNNTKQAFEYIKGVLSPFCDSITRDKMGNIIALKKSKNGKNGVKKVVLEVNIDEPGFVATFLKDGRATLHGIGKRGLSALGGKDAISSGGIIGKLVSDAEEPKASDYFFVSDSGVIAPGDTICPVRCPSVSDDGRIMLDGMGQKALCACLVDIAKLQLLLSFDLYFVFSSEKHTANRGAISAAAAIMPDYAIVLELVPKSDSHRGGAVILAKTNGALLSPSVTKELMEASDAAGTMAYVSAHTPQNDSSSAVHFISEGALCGACGVECDDFDNKGIINPSDIMSLEATLCSFLILTEERIGKEEENV